MPAAKTEEATTFVRVTSYPGPYPAEKRGESMEELDNGWEILAHVNMYLSRKKQCELKILGVFPCSQGGVWLCLFKGTVMHFTCSIGLVTTSVKKWLCTYIVNSESRKSSSGFDANCHVATFVLKVSHFLCDVVAKHS